MFQSQIRSFKRSCSVAAVILASGLLLSSPAFAESAVSHYDIPAESAAKALIDFSRQAGIQILYPYDIAANHNVAAIKGDYSREEVLAKILAGTGLEVATTTDKTISLREAIEAKVGASIISPATEVIVTGTRIRNTQPTSPVHVVTQKDIAASGYSQIGDVMRSLPENFSGGQNPGVVAAGSTNIQNQNLSNGSSVNLRGLGTDATLVLLNGHRLASDTAFQSGDISGIPLGAVQRIEIVTDGASSLYGSDAIAGAVNIILRRNLNGGTLSARVADSTQGGGGEQTLSLMQGFSFGNAYGLINVESSRQDALVASQRSYTSSAMPDTNLLRPQNRHSIFASAGVDVTSDLSFTIDALLSEREADDANQTSSASPLYLTHSYTPAYNLAASADFSIGNDWKAHLVGITAGGRNEAFTDVPAYSYSAHSFYRNDLQSAEINADGIAFTLPSGPVRLALGLGNRREGYDDGYTAADRSVNYAFAEAYIPLVAPSANRAGLHELALSLSGRIEDYSDFGSSSNPKIGLKYVPIAGLTLRSTWGTSFKAPSFLQMHQLTDVYLWKATSLGGVGSGTALMTYGGNPSLKPERSTSWTIGADYSPLMLPSMRIGATYFNLEYKDRVIQPINNTAVGLSNPIYLPFVELLPAPSRQANVIALGNNFFNYSGAPYDPTTVVAILQDNYQNATAQKIDGVDISYRQSFTLSGGAIDTFANATWLTIDQQTLVTLPEQRLSGTIYNAPKFKGRAGTAWEKGRIAASAIINLIGEETDTGVTPNAKIDSWVTVDGSISYEFERGESAASGLKFTLTGTNLFDRAPPFAASPGIGYEGLYYDSTNSSALGRLVALTISKSW